MLVNNQYLDFFKVNSLPTVLQPNAMYLVKGEQEGDLELHIADKNGRNTRSILSRKDVNQLIDNKIIDLDQIIDNKIINIDLTKIVKFEEVFNTYFVNFLQNINIDIDHIENFEQEVKECFNLFIQKIDINEIHNFETVIQQYFDLFIQNIKINVDQVNEFDKNVQTIISNTDIDVNQIVKLDKRIEHIVNNIEHTSKLEVKNTYQELKQLAEDKKLNKNQFVFVIDATSPEAKVDKGSATFLYQVPDQNSREKIETALSELKTLLDDQGIFDQEFEDLKADGYDKSDLEDILKAKQAVLGYLVNKDALEQGLNIQKNAILDFKDLGLLITHFVQKWNIFQDSIPKELHKSKSSTVYKIKTLIKELSDNYENFVARESAHKIIKVAEHESMDLKFEVKWGDIQDIPEPITKIITGQVLLQAVEW